MRNDKVTNFVTCWRMQLTNGQLLNFTDADEDIFFEEENYICGGYFTPNKIFSSNELAQDNFVISGIIDNKIITKKDLLEGKFSNGYLEVFLVSRVNLQDKRTILKTGWIGEIKAKEHKFTAEIISLGSKTNNVIGICYSSSCRAEFGDEFCKVNKDQYGKNGIISKLVEVNSFIDEEIKEPNDYFNQGVLSFTSGKNKGTKHRVIEFRDNKITLDSSYNLEITIGDEYTIIVGCNKTLSSCIDKFNNAINFRGEPFIPSKHNLVAK